MQAESRIIRGEELEKHLQARNNQRKSKTHHPVPGLSSTGILSVQDCNRQINHQKVEEMKKSRQKIQQENEKEKANDEAEKTVYKKLEADILNPNMPTNFDVFFFLRLQFGLNRLG